MLILRDVTGRLHGRVHCACQRALARTTSELAEILSRFRNLNLAFLLGVRLNPCSVHLGTHRSADGFRKRLPVGCVTLLDLQPAPNIDDAELYPISRKATQELRGGIAKLPAGLACRYRRPAKHEIVRALAPILHPRALEEECNDRFICSFSIDEAEIFHWNARAVVSNR